MNKKSELLSGLSTPNDDSHGQCYAPDENDSVKKKSIFQKVMKFLQVGYR